jgi:hypothetical protein
MLAVVVVELIMEALLQLVMVELVVVEMEVMAIQVLLPKLAPQILAEVVEEEDSLAIKQEILAALVSLLSKHMQPQTQTLQHSLHLEHGQHPLEQHKLNTL